MLTSDTFPLFAYRHYNNPQALDIEEFYGDLKRFKYLKKLVNRYLESGVLSEHLILNHLTVLFNLFGVEPSLSMLDYKLDEEHWPTIKPCLRFLGYIRPEDYPAVEADQHVLRVLEKI